MANRRSKKSYILYLLSIACLFSMGYLIYSNKAQVVGLKVAKKDYQEKIVTSGIVLAEEHSELTSEVPGLIEKINFREGSEVKRGQVIARLRTDKIDAQIVEAQKQINQWKSQIEKIETVDVKNYKAELDAAKENFGIVSKEYEKFKELYDQSFINQLDYDTKKNALLSAKSRVIQAQTNYDGAKGGSIKRIALHNYEQAKENLEVLRKEKEKYDIIAPYDGVVTRRFVEEGETAQPYSKLFTIFSTDNIYIKIDLDEKYLDKIKISDRVVAHPYADQSKFSHGNIYYIGSDVDLNSGTAELKARVNKLLPEFVFGASVNVIIEGRKFNETIVLPERYIYGKSGKNYVNLVENGKVAQREILVNQTINGVVIEKGLLAGDIVIEPRGASVGDKVEVSLQDVDFTNVRLN